MMVERNMLAKQAANVKPDSHIQKEDLESLAARLREMEASPPQIDSAEVGIHSEKVW